MRFKSIVSAAVVTAAVGLSAAVAQAGTTVKVVRGSLTPAAADGTQMGYFRLVDVERNGAVYQNLVVSVRGLDAAVNESFTGWQISYRRKSRKQFSHPARRERPAVACPAGSGEPRRTGA